MLRGAQEKKLEQARSGPQTIHGQRVQKAARAVASEHTRDDLWNMLSEAQQEACSKPGEGWRVNMFYGHVIHNKTLARLRAEYPGEYDYSPNRDPDYTHLASGYRVELTTEGQLPKHVQRDGLYVADKTDYATYKMPR